MTTKFLTVREAAKRLRCSSPIIRRAIRSGQLRGVRVGGGRVIRIPADALAEMASGGNGKQRTPQPVRRRRPRRALTR